MFQVRLQNSLQFAQRQPVSFNSLELWNFFFHVSQVRAVRRNNKSINSNHKRFCGWWLLMLCSNSGTLIRFRCHSVCCFLRTLDSTLLLLLLMNQLRNNGIENTEANLYSGGELRRIGARIELKWFAESKSLRWSQQSYSHWTFGTDYWGKGSYCVVLCCCQYPVHEINLY